MTMRISFFLNCHHFYRIVFIVFNFIPVEKASLTSDVMRRNASNLLVTQFLSDWHLYEKFIRKTITKMLFEQHSRRTPAEQVDSPNKWTIFSWLSCQKNPPSFLRASHVATGSLGSSAFIAIGCPLYVPA